MNKTTHEMAQEYRHLSFYQQRLANNGAVDEANAMNKQLNEIILALKEKGYPVRSLIENVKDEMKIMKEYEYVIIFSDGGVRNHHDSTQESKAASAFILYGNREILKQQGEYIGQMYTLPSGLKVEVSSTLAEYAGLLQGIDYVLDNRIKANKYIFVSDCSVMVEQILGKRIPSNPSLQECVDTCKKKMRLLKNVEIKHVERGKNKWADALVNDILNEHERMGVFC